MISLSRAAADRLNNSNNTKVRIDPIIVAQDGSLSGPGMACTTVAKQTYALPDRPDLGGGMGSASSAPVASAPQGDVRAISNDTLTAANGDGAPVKSGGFLGAPTPLNSGVLEETAPAVAAPAQTAAPVIAPVSAKPAAATAAAATGDYVFESTIFSAGPRDTKRRRLAYSAWSICQQRRGQHHTATFAERSTAAVVYYTRQLKRPEASEFSYM